MSTSRAATLLLGLAGVVAALLLPFAPVHAEETVVTWPQAGRLPESTTAFFVPYAPADVRVAVPCPVVRAGDRAGAPTTLVSSTPPGQPTEGFAVGTAAGDLVVLLGGQQVHRAPIPGGDCSVRLRSGVGGGELSVGGWRIDLPDDRVREIVTFSTDLAPEEAAGLEVRARTATWFESSPTAAKVALAAAQLVLAAAALVLLRRRDRGHRAPGAPRRAPGRWWWTADLGLLAAVGAWTALGPRTPDDAFTEGIVRNALETGAFTNYYRWQNAAEAPFTLVLHLVEPLVALHAAPLVLRLPSAVAAVLTWVLLSRGALPVALPAAAHRVGVRWLLAIALLAWWLPFGLGVRPEPFIALGTTAVLTCVLRGTERDGGALLLGLGALAAGLTIAVNPAGITALAPVLVLAPRIWRALRGTGPALGALAALALVCCLAAVGLVAMFADQSWYGVLRATELHRFYGPDVPWFEEFRRYGYLLGFEEFPEQGGFARRLPVLITLALLACAALLLARGGQQLPGLRSAATVLPATALAVAALALTPSKWTHYFGALAGLGALAATMSVVLIACAARHWSEHTSVRVIGGIGAGLTALAAGLAYAGTNTWFLHSHHGVPRDDGPLRPFDSPLLWALGAVAVLALARWRGRPAARRALAGLPAPLAATALGLAVVVLLGSFAVAPVRRAESFSVGGRSIPDAAGGCGIVDHVDALRDFPGGVLRPVRGQAELTGFEEAGGSRSGGPPGEWTWWGSAGGGPPSTGRMTSRWFGLPRLALEEELTVSVAGRTGDGNRLALEFGRRDPAGDVRWLGERVLDDAYRDADERPVYPSDRLVRDRPQDTPEWRALHLDPAEVPPGADLVRVHAVDGTTDGGGWLATTAPRLRRVVPLRSLLRAQESVYVDWSMVWNAPCVRRSPRVGGGLAEAPTALLIPPEELGFSGEAAFVRDIGGSFAGVSEAGDRTTVPTRLRGTEDAPEYADWGEFVLVSYPQRRDAYDTRTHEVLRWGWEGDRTPLTDTNT
ncbi:arabinosyltransferase domain-containing protein [Saccharopolyspora cebuensis]|uniref:Arabinosyltransferase domain-containing protein n=1 Tax=Saccharopolyspora cebuensis TaxID=418759 RepID=A0ABV4CJD1_9PSEU